jgi:replication factor C subunit 2/4
MNNYIKKKKGYCESIKIPWIEKYRPNNINDILLNKFIKTKLCKIIERNNIPNMIITGEPGTGKTSTVLCLLKKLYDANLYKENILELNASDDRGLSIINNVILPFSKKKTNKNVNKIIVLDEADSITNKAQNLLSNILAEQNIKTKFIFICNDCSKINESIQSKCIMIQFPKISKKNILSKIEYISKNENIEYDKEGLESLLFVSDNDIRQSINNLECIYHSYKKITKETVYDFVDLPKPIYIEKILNFILNKKFNESINTVKELHDKGYSANDILLTFMNFLLEDKLLLDEEMKLKIYEIVSLTYIKVNDGIQTLLQLCGCISKIYLYLDK